MVLCKMPQAWKRYWPRVEHLRTRGSVAYMAMPSHAQRTKSLGGMELLRLVALICFLLR